MNLCSGRKILRRRVSYNQPRMVFISSAAPSASILWIVSMSSRGSGSFLCNALATRYMASGTAFSSLRRSRSSGSHDMLTPSSM